VRLLLAAGADVAAKNDKGQTAAEVRALRSRGRSSLDAERAGAMTSARGQAAHSCTRLWRWLAEQS